MGAAFCAAGAAFSSWLDADDLRRSFQQSITTKAAAMPRKKAPHGLMLCMVKILPSKLFLEYEIKHKLCLYLLQGSGIKPLHPYYLYFT
jgi:hypothetical protein